MSHVSKKEYTVGRKRRSTAPAATSSHAGGYTLLRSETPAATDLVNTFMDWAGDAPLDAPPRRLHAAALLRLQARLLALATVSLEDVTGKVILVTGLIRNRRAGWEASLRDVAARAREIGSPDVLVIPSQGGLLAWGRRSGALGLGRRRRVWRAAAVALLPFPLSFGSVLVSELWCPADDSGRGEGAVRVSEDPNCVLSTWRDADNDPCGWPGVTCVDGGGGGRVGDVELANFSLTSYLPSELSLPYNQLAGQIPL
uniref:Leucine-rich repeat-containing N-terminal plant-type domain-containing protein n=1 Tax=Oryza rufipogon TaxID=4529 RepID=A0A0E0MZC7_ORYRU